MRFWVWDVTYHFTLLLPDRSQTTGLSEEGSGKLPTLALTIQASNLGLVPVMGLSIFISLWAHPHPCPSFPSSGKMSSKSMSMFFLNRYFSMPAFPCFLKGSQTPSAERNTSTCSRSKLSL